jgi:2-keto-4-pentenoate hydratase/2-oxohepta-3-ene-1,7-dioic acid hydratase in catechol pathway
MKLCRFNDNRLGVFEGAVLKDVTEALEVLPPLYWPVPQGDHFFRHFTEIRRAIAARLATAPVVSTADIRYLSPVVNASKIIAAPLNYTKHVVEVGNDPQIHAGTHSFQYDGFLTPIDKLGLFLKAGSSVVGPSDGITLVYPERRTDHEVELVAIIGREGKDITEGEAMGYVCAYCIGLDMTVRGPEDRSFRKSPDSYTVLGPVLVTADEIDDPARLDLSITVNGIVKQDANTKDLTVDLPRLVAIASSCYTLYPGDVIMTGTPDGVAPVAPGDRIVATISSLGDMQVSVRAGSPSSGVHGQKAVAQ